MNFTERRSSACAPVLLIACVFGAFTVSACAGGPPPAPALKPVYLADGKAVSLLPPRAVGRPFAVRQSLEGRYRAQNYSLEAFVKAESDMLTLIALSDFGIEVYRLTYHETGIDFTSVPFSAAVPPEYLLADFQLCYFPATAVASMVGAAGLVFIETKTADGWVREVRDGTATIISVRRAGRTIEYHNLLRGYDYVIREAEEESP